MHARQSIVVVVVRQVSEAIAADVMNTMAYFHSITEFPHDVRAIDCTTLNYLIQEMKIL